jgi:cyclic pyranopterin monophosphate synthase
LQKDRPTHDERLTHVDEQGAARMVDVGAKSVTFRSATARAVCNMNIETAESVRANSIRKGDVLQVARLAGIGAAKRTDELIPLCHSVLLDSVSVEFEWLTDTALQVLATANCSGRTGVEMEAMVAVSMASLTVYDMCKASDREIRIERVELLRKSGGVRGDFERSEGN